MKKILFLIAFVIAALQLSATSSSFCVVDFTSIDMAGLKRFVDGRNKPLEIPGEQIIECTGKHATTADNDSDAAPIKGSSILANIMITGSLSEQWKQEWPEAREVILVKDAEFKLDEKRMHLEQERRILGRILESNTRPVITGAQHFEALLASQIPGLKLVPRQVFYASMTKQAAAQDFPTDFLKRVAKESGVTHIVTGTLSDMRSKKRVFESYSIRTESIIYEIDLMVKAVSITDGTVVASDVYTGRASVRKQPGLKTLTITPIRLHFMPS